MDISIPGMDGIAATRAIHAELPDIRIIGLSMFEERDRAAAPLPASIGSVPARLSWAGSRRPHLLLLIGGYGSGALRAIDTVHLARILIDARPVV